MSIKSSHEIPLESDVLKFSNVQLKCFKTYKILRIIKKGLIFYGQL